jgi:cobyrinic acid a,c-diamide synthase
VSMTTRALLIGAPSSASGKTTVTLGLLRCLRNRGLRVASVKVGPDYIDPAFHRQASGRSCINLDSWAMRPVTLAASARGACASADVVIGEGVMGLFDGADDGRGSTADLAMITGWPVVLVVDAHGQAASAAATVHGFATFRPDMRPAAIIFNRVGGERHAQILRQACAPVGIPVLGCLPSRDDLVLPARHLGLVQAAEHPDLEDFLQRAAVLIDQHVDCDALVALASAGKAHDCEEGSPGLPPLGQSIAVAEDVAFAFAYPGQLAAWQQAGVSIAPFSPLADEAPPEADAIYLPGGYPELHAGRLAANDRFLTGVRQAARRGKVIYGECGGYMVMGRGIVDAAGVRHAMLDLLPLETSFACRRLHLGYRDAQLAASGPLGAAGDRFRGHEFHFATIVTGDGGRPLFLCRDSEGCDCGAAGSHDGLVMGSFVHLIDRA